MCSGAVLIDEEGEGDGSTTRECPPHHTHHDSKDDCPSTEMVDVDEDRVMQQAVDATRMKNELMGSIKELNTCDENNRTVEEKEPNDDTIKPSILRRISLFQNNT